MSIEKPTDDLETAVIFAMARIAEVKGNEYFTSEPLTDEQEAIQQVHRILQKIPKKET